MRLDVERVETIIREVCEEHVLPRFRNLKQDDVSTKTGPNDLVTVADVAAEKALAPRLTALLPGSVVLGEEGASTDPSLMEALGADAPVWVIDPIDGTRNFVKGIDEFATMVALVEKGETLAAWIHPPVSGDGAIAEAGGGARRSGAVLRARRGGALEDLAGTYHRSYVPKPWRARIEAAMPKLGRSFPAPCSAFVYLRLAGGERDFGVHGKLMPWDHAAGVLMLREAGGEAVFLDADERYAPKAYPDRPMLTVADGARADAIKGALVGDSA